jgi:leucyl/phenylalanyl-tRNA--protein transferase
MPDSSAGMFDFPLPEDDCVAVGADLRPTTLLAAYRAGLFPMPHDGELLWWSPLERGVLVPGALRVTRSMRQSAKKYTVTVDTCFSDVMRACADPRRPQGWITGEFVDAYSRLHELGIAHSVEVRSGGELVGGLYGLQLGSLFAGESMFHTARDASKVALMALVDRLDTSGATWLIDTQWVTDHLASLGVGTLSREDYLTAIGPHTNAPDVIWA